MARTAGRVALDSCYKPPTDRRRLSEADRANMELFLENLHGECAKFTSISMKLSFTSRVAGPRPPGNWRRFAFGFEVYDVALRPCAHYLLGCLREIGCVSLLTTSQRDYAERINESFGLGFEKLYCREDIFVFRPFADLKAEAVAPKIRLNPTTWRQLSFSEVETEVPRDQPPKLDIPDSRISRDLPCNN